MFNDEIKKIVNNEVWAPAGWTDWWLAFFLIRKKKKKVLQDVLSQFYFKQYWHCIPVRVEKQMMNNSLTKNDTTTDRFCDAITTLLLNRTAGLQLEDLATKQCDLGRWWCNEHFCPDHHLWQWTKRAAEKNNFLLFGKYLSSRVRTAFCAQF